MPANTLYQRLKAVLGWSRSSYFILSSFLVIIGLIIVVWRPLVEEYMSYFEPHISIWRQIDWLLVGIFIGMSVLIMVGADLKKDIWITLVGIAGGLAIESWGTQTRLWTYFTYERPPLWIIPAWPIATLSIDRLVKLADEMTPTQSRLYRVIYWVVFPAFIILMIAFVWPTIDKYLTWWALLICFLLLLSTKDHRLALIYFFAGSGLGYFLEVWGTTRQCWTYYTYQTPPVFAVFAHGLAAVIFWKASEMSKRILSNLASIYLPNLPFLPIYTRKKTQYNKDTYSSSG